MEQNHRIAYWYILKTELEDCKINTARQKQSGLYLAEMKPMRNPVCGLEIEIVVLAKTTAAISKGIKNLD